MEATRARVAASGTVCSDRPAVRIVASDEVREAVRARGGSVYVRAHVHGVCEGKVTFLDVATEPPAGVAIDPPFERIEAGDMDVFLSIGSLLRPAFLELELRGRKKRLRAYWNGQASVG